MVPQVMLSGQGPRFSRIVHGWWRLNGWGLDRKGICHLIEGCVTQGITTFDHADIYGEYTCEELFGSALADSGVDRTAIQLVTKCGIKLVSPRRPSHRIKSYDTSCAHIVASVENSLRCLQTDYIDLLLIHRPNPLIDPREVNEAFVRLRQSGKVRHFGVSNFLPHQWESLASKLEVPLVTNQIEYSVMNLAAHGDGNIDWCQKLEIRPMAWSPFGGGRLFFRRFSPGQATSRNAHSDRPRMGGSVPRSDRYGLDPQASGGICAGIGYRQSGAYSQRGSGVADRPVGRAVVRNPAGVSQSGCAIVIGQRGRLNQKISREGSRIVSISSHPWRPRWLNNTG